MDGNEIAAMLYQTDPDPLHDFIFAPGDYGYVDLDEVARGTAEACKNIKSCSAKFFKRSVAGA